MRPSVVVALVLALAFCRASAQPPTPQPPQDTQAEEASLHGCGDGDKSYQEWTGGCRTCRRSDAGAPVCPNIGIACQPKAITCARRVRAATE
jgi:hypothetical protein